MLPSPGWRALKWRWWWRWGRGICCRYSPPRHPADETKRPLCVFVRARHCKQAISINFICYICVGVCVCAWAHRALCRLKLIEEFARTRTEAGALHFADDRDATALLLPFKRHQTIAQVFGYAHPQDWLWFPVVCARRSHAGWGGGWCADADTKSHKHARTHTHSDYVSYSSNYRARQSHANTSKHYSRLYFLLLFK